MAKFQSFSHQMLTKASRMAIFGMCPHISSSYSMESLTLTPKVIEGHWRSLEVNLPSHKCGQNSKTSDFMIKLI